MTVIATDPREGFFTFVHHNVLIEYSWDIDERIRAIETEKPEHERATRLRCLTYVPEERLPRAYVKAWRAYDEARRVRDEARRVRDEARRVRDEARRACDGAHYDEVRALALSLVPDAPWDGWQLVFAR